MWQAGEKRPAKGRRRKSGCRLAAMAPALGAGFSEVRVLSARLTARKLARCLTIYVSRVFSVKGIQGVTTSTFEWELASDRAVRSR